MNFTDQKRRVATAEECALQWNGGAVGRYFRCYLCGHRFKPGDGWRFLFGVGPASNMMTCDECDGPDVMDRWIAANEEVKTRFWWFRPRS